MTQISDKEFIKIIKINKNYEHDLGSGFKNKMKYEKIFLAKNSDTTKYEMAVNSENVLTDESGYIISNENKYRKYIMNENKYYMRCNNRKREDSGVSSAGSSQHGCGLCHLQLLSWSYQVARGMDYLHGKK
ncbi:unnamed protein product, partial [Meganyctiphanes norvegica]